MTEVQHATTDDGRTLAWRSVGHGPCVIAPAMCWLWPDLDAWTSKIQLVLYDVRGQGASARVEDDQIGLARDVRDLECVRQAAGVDAFALFGWSYYGAIAVHYAARHPERVRAVGLSAPIAPRAQPYWRATWRRSASASTSPHCRPSNRLVGPGYRRATPRRSAGST